MLKPFTWQPTIPIISTNYIPLIFFWIPYIWPIRWTKHRQWTTGPHPPPGSWHQATSTLSMRRRPHKFRGRFARAQSCLCPFCLCTQPTSPSRTFKVVWTRRRASASPPLPLCTVPSLVSQASVRFRVSQETFSPWLSISGSYCSFHTSVTMPKQIR